MKKPIPFGKYYLLERMNVGGMAEVFRAKAYGVEGFERLVAVKRILPNIAEDKEFIRMFVDEAKIAVQLNHANIAQIFDLGMVDGSYYIALEHVHGRDLRNIFDRCRHVGDPMPIAQACFILMKVCEGLDYAHNKRDQAGRELNLVHRDVSPQNMLVSFEGEVKVIDFGIAKAAGKGSKTQAGILKGKFGYMSPEQVRGLPIDRRSDVFACGIVLYELLTGERLFVGESDFSTLEKVRNVEILPPSTYNRRIPEELERIVLKALAKDVDDRYQNAIDLHDELQAFVYTAGEFYSRKDLAAWMKRRFAREIDEESAKLEAYRQMPPPEAAPAARAPSEPAIEDPTTARPSLSAVGTKPPPIPPSAGDPGALKRTLMGSGPMRNMQPEASSTHPGKAAARRAAPLNGSNGQSSGNGKAKGRQPDIDWDDDELETSIYDHDDGPSGPTVPLPVAAASGGSAAMTMAGHGPQASPGEPDLAALARDARGWSENQPPPSLDALEDAIHAPAVEDQSPRSGLINDAEPAPEQLPETGSLADGSNRKKSPFGPESAPPPGYPGGGAGAGIDAGASPHARAGSEAYGPGGYAAQFPIAGRMRADRSKTGVVAAIAVLALLIGGGGLAIFFIAKKGQASETTASASLTAPDESAAAATAPEGDPAAGQANQDRPDAPAAMDDGPDTADPAGVHPDTGFDLIVDPPGVEVKLDGKIIGKAPLQIRNLLAGDHFVEIEGPPGFFNKSQTVSVTRGEAERVTIKLRAMEITGKFTSEPPGARVTLVSDGRRVSVGKTPITAQLDPRKRYDVVFKKDGYVTITKPIEFGAGPEVPVPVVLERARPVAVVRDAPKPAPAELEPERVARTPERKPERKVERDPPRRERPKRPERDRDEGDSFEEVDTGGGFGTLMLGSKPPCKIYVDGRNTGKRTPQRGIRLKAGSHRITLVNNEYGIKETFTVKVKADETVKRIKDFSDQM